MRRVVAVLSRETADNLVTCSDPADYRALRQALRAALDPARVDHDPGEFEALARAWEDALHRYVALDPCPNYGEATESCGCLICRTQTLITEWQDVDMGDGK